MQYIITLLLIIIMRKKQNHHLFYSSAIWKHLNPEWDVSKASVFIHCWFISVWINIAVPFPLYCYDGITEFSKNPTNLSNLIQFHCSMISQVLLMFNFPNHTTETHHRALQQIISMNKGCNTALLLSTPDSIAWYLSKLRALRNILTNLLRMGINRTISTTASRCQGFDPCEEQALSVSFQGLARMEAVISQVNFHVPFCHFTANLAIDSVIFEMYSQKNMCFSSNSTPWLYWQQTTWKHRTVLRVTAEQ